MGCRILHALSEGMPDALFGKTLREVYVNSLAGGESEDWNQFIRLIGLSSSHELKMRIESALVILMESGASNSSDLSNNLVVFTEELKRLEETPDADIGGSPKSQNVFVPQGKKLDKFELKAVRFFIYLTPCTQIKFCCFTATNGYCKTSSPHNEI